MSIIHLESNFFLAHQRFRRLTTSWIFDFWRKTAYWKFLVPWMLKSPLTSVLKYTGSSLQNWRNKYFYYSTKHKKLFKNPRSSVQIWRNKYLFFSKDWPGKKVTILWLKFLIVKSWELYKSFYLHFTWLCGSWNQQRIFEK